MDFNHRRIGILIAAAVLIVSCQAIEKASKHGLISGYYKMRVDTTKTQDVYLDITADKINIHRKVHGQSDKSTLKIISLQAPDSLAVKSVVFKKQNLDVDLTSVLFKYRPSAGQLPAQMTTDLNIALYAGWRHDSYYLKAKKDPLGRVYQKITGRGYDYGLFAGPGTTLVSPFTTHNRQPEEYSGLIIQTGIAGFIESEIASFGLSAGFDFLLNQDRKLWVYRNKPWVGFIIGIALN